MIDLKAHQPFLGHVGVPITPCAFWPTSGDAEGDTTLNAFDNALLEAGIGNVNLVKLSSVIPQNAKLLTERPPDMEHGAVVFTIYSYRTSCVPGQTVAAAIGLGFTPDGKGMAYEDHSVGSKKDVEDFVAGQIEEGFRQRGWELDHKIIVSSEHTVEKIGCALAAVPLWWTN